MFEAHFSFPEEMMHSEPGFAPPLDYQNHVGKSDNNSEPNKQSENKHLIHFTPPFKY